MTTSAKAQTASSRPTKAMVLAAGFGKRMMPLTKTMPKPMVAFRGRPLVDHVLDRLAQAGITEAIVNVHYLADELERHVNKRTSPKITVSDERDALLDTGGGVTRALPLLGEDPFVIHNSDSVWEEGIGNNIERLLNQWQPERMDSLLLMALTSRSIGYEGSGDFVMDAEGRLQRRQEARQAPFVFAGVSIAHPRLFADAPDGPFSLNLLWDRAINKGRLFGAPLDGTWMHIGTPQALAEAERWRADAPTG